MMKPVKMLSALLLLLLLPAMAFAGEECSMMGGICKDACADDEEAEVGAFLDCTDKQECCVKKVQPPAKDASDAGPSVDTDRN
ncbi:MAG: hypothetical protein FIA94_07335 [Nitrospirae bacterium]|nr:hypothetical protein [Nitrospirota bacterium]